MKQRKKKQGFRRPVVIKKPKQPQEQPSVDPITGKKIPKSFVFSRGKLPAPLKQLQMDLRKLMLPYTALSLRVSLIFLSSSLFLLFMFEWTLKWIIYIYIYIVLVLICFLVMCLQQEKKIPVIHHSERVEQLTQGYSSLISLEFESLSL